MTCSSGSERITFDVNTSPVLHWNYRCSGVFPAELLEKSDTISDIYLKENNIEVFPRELCYFKYLKHLYLSGNNLREVPKEIEMIQTLSCLDLRGNLLTSLPEEISNIRNMKYLFLDENQLSSLPTSLRKLKKIRELSVKDNKLLWLPQRPLSNYYAGKFEFWGNRLLHHAPFSLWLHLLKDLQIKTFNIGCFQYPFRYTKENLNKVVVKKTEFFPGSEIILPSKYNDIQQYPHISPPTLVELSMRKCYTMIDNMEKDNENNNWDRQIMKGKNEIRHNGNDELDENGNFKEDVLVNMLPSALNKEIFNGPPAFCDIYSCRMPLFRSAILEIILRPIILPEKSPEILLSAFFCSGGCRDKWMRAHLPKPLSWDLA